MSSYRNTEIMQLVIFFYIGKAQKNIYIYFQS